VADRARQRRFASPCPIPNPSTLPWRSRTNGSPYRETVPAIGANMSPRRSWSPVAVGGQAIAGRHGKRSGHSRVPAGSCPSRASLTTCADQLRRPRADAESASRPLPMVHCHRADAGLAASPAHVQSPPHPSQRGAASTGAAECRRFYRPSVSMTSPDMTAPDLRVSGVQVCPVSVGREGLVEAARPVATAAWAAILAGASEAKCLGRPPS
jgi:hypothetical protein